MREIVLDTETTGLDPSGGHRVVELACLELAHHVPSGRHFRRYINPEREVPEDARAIHGLTDEFLAKPARPNEIVEAVDRLVGRLRQGHGEHDGDEHEGEYRGTSSHCVTLTIRAIGANASPITREVLPSGAGQRAASAERVRPDMASKPRASCSKRVARSRSPR